MATHNTAADIEERDESELAGFGYKQELKRDWGLMHNFGISFSIIVSFLCAKTLQVSYSTDD